jgi:hypothetical protein
LQDICAEGRSRIQTGSSIIKLAFLIEYKDRYDCREIINTIVDLVVLISANPHVNRPNHSSFVPGVFLVALCSGKIIIDLFNRIRAILGKSP